MLKKEDLKVGEQIINHTKYPGPGESDWINQSVGQVLTIIKVSGYRVELDWPGSCFHFPCNYSNDAELVNSVIDSYYSIL